MYPVRSFLLSFSGSKKGFLTAAILIFSLICLSATPAEAARKKASAENPKYASLIIDADTGVVLHQRYADKPLHPASLTKVMTLLLLFEAIERGQLTYETRIPISRHAASQSPSKLGIPAGQSIKVKDAIGALVTKSANDIAVAVAEKLGGTETGFARMMTARAEQIGMSSTRFKNASGLHNPRQISTARDMGKLARFVITQYPQYYRHFGTKNFSYQGHNYHNHNRLMSSYRGMDGMKTGYIGPSGFNLVASAVRGNHRLIGVVFGGRSASSRNAHMASLLDTSFARLGTGKPLTVANADVITTPSIAPPPVPARKPGVLVALNALNSVTPTGGAGTLAAPQTAQPVLTAAATTTATPAEPETALYNGIIGEGDYDPAMSSRIRTGLIAINAYRGTHQQPQAQKSQDGSFQTASISPQDLTVSSSDPRWSIQIGAFTSRAATDQALQNAKMKLPKQYGFAGPAIAPLRTKDGWLFRARLAGYTKEQAFNACRHLKDCMPVAPNN